VPSGRVLDALLRVLVEVVPRAERPPRPPQDDDANVVFIGRRFERGLQRLHQVVVQGVE
jgi:hypothetical protein